MWVFGYGSLMCDGWEAEFGGTQKARATLQGFRRDFNKASTKNWGTPELPAPTLGLVPGRGLECAGFAFELPEKERGRVIAALRTREGRSFALEEKLVTLESGQVVSALVPINDSSRKTFIGNQSIEARARLARAATGSKGSGVAYVMNIRQTLQQLGIDDPAVEEFWTRVSDGSNAPARHAAVAAAGDSASSTGDQS